MLGAPIALQDALVNVSFLLITVIVNQMGVIASAALGVVEKIIVFAMLPPMAISSAMMPEMVLAFVSPGMAIRIVVTNETLPLFGNWFGIDIRGIGLRLFPVFTRYANRNLYKGSGCNCNGFRILAWI